MGTFIVGMLMLVVGGLVVMALAVATGWHGAVAGEAGIWLCVVCGLVIAIIAALLPHLH